MSEYIKKLENILEGVENYRYDDMSCAEWEEVTKHVSKGAIAREKANQEADELASSVWNRLERKLTETKLNENQEIVLEWLKEQKEEHVATPFVLFYQLTTRHSLITTIEILDAFDKLTDKEEFELIQAFATWALDQC